MPLFTSDEEEDEEQQHHGARSLGNHKKKMGWHLVMVHSYLFFFFCVCGCNRIINCDRLSRTKGEEEGGINCHKLYQQGAVNCTATKTNQFRTKEFRGKKTKNVFFSFSVGGQRVVGGDRMLLYSVRMGWRRAKFCYCFSEEEEKENVIATTPFPFLSMRTVSITMTCFRLDSRRVFPLQRRLFFAGPNHSTSKVWE